MDNYTIYGALFESMVRKAIFQQYIDNGATIDEAERFTEKTQLKIVDGVLFATIDGGFISRLSITPSITLNYLPDTPEIQKHNEALKTKLLNTDFSKL